MTRIRIPIFILRSRPSRMKLSLLLLLLLFCFQKNPTLAERTLQEQAAMECSADGDCQEHQQEDNDNNGDNGKQNDIVDYLIVGAGGSGIQTALFLEKYGYTYQILEKEHTAGSFWTRFPVFRELISVNKLSRNATQQYRFDWHSMLETPLLMWNITEEYYPTGQDWHRYMTKVVEQAGIPIEYGVEVLRLDNDRPCVVVAGGSSSTSTTTRTPERRCAKYRVFVGTGLQEKNEPYLRAVGGIPYSQITREQARGKIVCIAGNGNAGFEVAQNLFTVADRVFLYGKRAARLSSVTKYTGDVRVKFLTVLENFHGKLLDSVLQMGDYKQMRPFIEDADLLNATQFEQAALVLNWITLVNFHRCEVFVLATGFRSTVPGMQLTRRFPESTDWYASQGNPAVHYVGWLMHQHDFRRGAGGFLSGYRYLIRNLVHHVREVDHNVPYPFLRFTKQQALDHAAKRFQVADDLVILQDGVSLRDAIVPVTVKKSKKVEYHYYEGITYKFHKDLLEGRDDVIYLYFGWGNGRSAASVFDNVYLFEGTTDLINIYLHPVVEVNGLIREAEEDLDMIWNTKQHIPPIKRIVRDAIKGDFSKFYPKPNFSYKRAEVKKPKRRPPHEQGVHEGLGFYPQMTKKTVNAVRSGGTMESLRTLRATARKNMPSLIFPTKKKKIANSTSTS